jgi:hypothetical protein
MGNKNKMKSEKKKKKVDAKPVAQTTIISAVTPQPALVEKHKKKDEF